MDPQTAQNPVKPAATSAVILIGVALLALLLGSYQWYELYEMRTSGASPLCAVSENLDCAAVWTSPLATAVHGYTGLPFAAWGVVWSGLVLILALQLRRRQLPAAETILALRLITGAGALLSIGLLIYSITLGVFCPTCLLFYVFVAIGAYLAFARLHPEQYPWPRAALHDLGLLLVIVAVLLYPGLQTPKQDLASATLAKISAASPGHHDVDLSQDPLAKFLRDLEPQVRQIVSDAHALYRIAPRIETPVDIDRIVSGNSQAPVHLIDWVDIRCPHCRSLDEALNEIRGVTPNTSWTEESRHFPLDSECNAGISRSDGSGVACLSAKLLICLAGSPQGNLVRTALFDDQRTLTTERVWEIAAEHRVQRAPLEKCVASPETAATLRSDIQLANRHGIEGTPLLVINGRQAPPFPPFIFAMIIAAGDSNAAGFQVLPPPRPEVLAR